MKHLAYLKPIKTVFLWLLLLCIIYTGVSFAWDLRVEIPNGEWFQDIIADDPFITWNKASNSFTKFVQLANTYLWIAVLVVFMIMLIYAWFTLITSRWDAEKFKKGNMMLMYIGIWLWVALLAYVIINVLVNLF